MTYAYKIRIILIPEWSPEAFTGLYKFFTAYIQGFHIGYETKKPHHHLYCESNKIRRPIADYISSIYKKGTPRLKGNQAYSCVQIPLRDIHDMHYPIDRNPTSDSIIFSNIDQELEAKIRDHVPPVFCKKDYKNQYSEIKHFCRDKFPTIPFKVELIDCIMVYLQMNPNRAWRPFYIVQVAESILLSYPPSINDPDNRSHYWIQYRDNLVQRMI